MRSLSKEHFIELRSSIPHDIFVAFEIPNAVHGDVAHIELLQVDLFDTHKSDLSSVYYRQ